MGTTYGVTYPCIQDGLVFYADAKNRKSWDGGTTMCDPFQQQYSGSGTNVTGDNIFFKDVINRQSQWIRVGSPTGETAATYGNPGSG